MGLIRTAGEGSSFVAGRGSISSCMLRYDLNASLMSESELEELPSFSMMDSHFSLIFLMDPGERGFCICRALR